MKAITVTLGIITAAFAVVQYAFSKTTWEYIGACDGLDLAVVCNFLLAATPEGQNLPFFGAPSLS